MATDLSVIIPAYNEAQRLPATLTRIAGYFAAQPREVEIIVVDDGSTDATAALLSTPPAGPINVHWRLLRNPGNRGKGYSVRHGMLEASGRLRLFTDADLSAPIEEITKLEAALQAGADIAIGSRSRRDLIHVHQNAFRENAGRAFNLMVRLGLGLPFHDTQCGFKLFTAKAAEAIFPHQQIEGWGFDPELLYLARRLGLLTTEVPVIWGHAEGAKIRMLRDSLRMFGDIVRVRANGLRGKYPLGNVRRRAASG